MFVLMKSHTSSKMSYVGSKTRSLGQILGKPCVRSRGHIFSPLIMKHSENVCLGESRRSLKMGHVGSKTRSVGQILGKSCVCSKGNIFNTIHMKFGQSICLDKILDELENG